MVSSENEGLSQSPESRPRVMLADDESHVRLYLKYVLNTLNINIVAEVSNGKDAVAMYREKQPDLVLMDLNMPVQTGEEALLEILADFPKAKVIILSSSADRDNVETCAGLGAANYIRKDCAFNEICEVVKETLDQP
jgi:two-component system, chemotaxis family, chemotaxis protein CheY